MADQAWSQVNALIEDETRVPKGAVADPPYIGLVGLNEANIRFFTEHVKDDYRTRDFGIKCVIEFFSGNRLYVTESYSELADMVKMKVKN